MKRHLGDSSDADNGDLFSKLFMSGAIVKRKKDRHGGASESSSASAAVPNDSPEPSPCHDLSLLPDSSSGNSSPISCLSENQDVQQKPSNAPHAPSHRLIECVDLDSGYSSYFSCIKDDNMESNRKDTSDYTIKNNVFDVNERKKKLIFVKVFPLLKNIADGVKMYGPFASELVSFESFLPTSPDHFYMFEGTRIVTSARLASLLSHAKENHTITLELFSVESEPQSWDNYVQAVRLLAPSSKQSMPREPPESSSKETWEYLRFVDQTGSKSVIIRNIDPTKQTLASLFGRESIPVPLKLMFDGEVLDFSSTPSELCLEDGDSIEIFY